MFRKLFKKKRVNIEIDIYTVMDIALEMQGIESFLSGSVAIDKHDNVCFNGVPAPGKVVYISEVEGSEVLKFIFDRGMGDTLLKRDTLTKMSIEIATKLA